MGWAGKKNGELLKLMATQNYEVLLTVDQNIRYQQHLQAANVVVLVLVAPTNRLADLVPLMPAAIAAMSTIKAGDVIEITA